MLKYLKQLVQEVITQGRKLVGGTEARPVNIREEMEGEATILRHEEARELTTSLREKKSLAGVNRVEKNGRKDIGKMGGNVSPYCEKVICESEVEKTRDICLSKKNVTPGKAKNEVKEEICDCANCSIVSIFNECAVCLESLQTRGVRSCPVCANIVCSRCAEKIKHCPFCRSFYRMQKNRAIERLIAGLFLPCNNARSGCREMLNAEMRPKHESICDYASTNCPVSRICCWNGLPASILSHLKNAHGLKPLEDHGVTVEISSFRRKTFTREGEYTIYLSCYGQLFSVKITLCRKKLILSFSQLGYVTRITEKLLDKKYGAWIKVKLGGKQLSGILSFGKFDRKKCDTEINCETIWPTPEVGSRNGDDKVTIEITIRETKVTMK